MFIVDRGDLRFRRQLGLERLRDILAEMFADVPRDRKDPPIGAGRNAPAFVKQRRDGLVAHRLIDCVGVNNAAEFRGGVLVLFFERRAGEADVAGVRQYFPHPRVGLAVLAAVAFVNQGEDVVRIALIVRRLHRRLELVDHSGDDRSLLTRQQLEQMTARRRLHRFFAATVERGPDLVVQVDAVGHQNYSWIDDALFQRNRFRHHHHRQRFPRPLRVLDDAPGASAVRPDTLDSLQGLLDGEVLLVAGDLFLAGVEDDKLARQLDQPLGPEKTINRPVLFRDRPPCHVRFVEAPTSVSEAVREEFILLPLHKRFVDQPADLLIEVPISVRPFSPLRPELRRRSSGGVFRLVLVYRQEYLRVDEETRNALALLIPQMLRDGALDRVLLVGPAAFDHCEGNAVDEENDIRTTALLPGGPLDLELFGDVKDVVLRTLPIDVIQCEALSVAVDRLLEALAQGDQVVNPLVRPRRPVGQGDVLQRQNRGLNVRVGKFVVGAFKTDPVEATQLFFQDAFEQRIRQFAPALQMYLLPPQVDVAQVLKQLQRRDLRDVVFEE